MIITKMQKLISDKDFALLMNISPKSLTFLQIFNLESSYIEVWFTGQNSKPLEIENKVNLILVIN